MKTTYECGGCGVISDDRDQLCHPQSLVGKHDSCHPTQDQKQICSSMDDKVSYSCASCGRPADDPRLICDPQRRD